MGICRGAGDRVAPDPGGMAGYGRKGAGCVEMGESFSVADTAAAGALELSDAVVQPTRGPPPGRAASGPESTPGLTGDHACVAGALDDVVRPAVLGRTGPGSRARADRRVPCGGPGPARRQRAGSGDHRHHGHGVQIPPAERARQRAARLAKRGILWPRCRRGRARWRHRYGWLVASMSCPMTAAG